MAGARYVQRPFPPLKGEHTEVKFPSQVETEQSLIIIVIVVVVVVVGGPGGGFGGFQVGSKCSGKPLLRLPRIKPPKPPPGPPTPKITLHQRF